jgi:DNA (cytosine-5)-methyltransferase 1
MKAGSLCTGIAGLDMAAHAVYGAELAWYSELEPAPCQILEREHPGVPNLGDLTAIDWAQLEPVDILTAGYPCQPFSHAGNRKGADDVRHLWPYIAEAVRVLRPRRVVLENVAGHLSLGFGSVLGDLAEARFDAEWCVLRASDVGACHQRARLFIVARNADGARADALTPPGSSRGAAGESGRTAEHADGGGLEASGPGGDGTDGPLGAGRGGEQHLHTASHPGAGPAPYSRGERHVAADAADLGHERGGPARRRGDGPTDSGHPAADADQIGLWGGGEPGDAEAPRLQGAPSGRGMAVAWGQYAPAIARWAATLGRPAPAPTDDRGRLSPAFVEWMMGYPAGWVDGLTRTQALKALGNAVVPQQGAAAVALLEAAHQAVVAA